MRWRVPLGLFARLADLLVEHPPVLLGLIEIEAGARGQQRCRAGSTGGSCRGPPWQAGVRSRAAARCGRADCAAPRPRPGAARGGVSSRHSGRPPAGPQPRRIVPRGGRRPAGGGGEEPLHQPVLQRMERDHHEPSARRQQRRGLRQPALDLAQLVVHPDAQRLEAARRRVDAGAIGRHHAADDGGERARWSRSAPRAAPPRWRARCARARRSSPSSKTARPGPPRAAG